jgi:hypothetical protein
MVFKKGQSGNPTGRPKDVNGLTELARAMVPEALEVLRSIYMDESERGPTRTRALEILLERAMGAVPKTLTVDGNNSMLCGTTIDGQAVPVLGRVPLEQMILAKLNQKEQS